MVGFVRGRKATPALVTTLVMPAVAIAAVTPLFRVNIGVTVAVIAAVLAVEIVVAFVAASKRGSASG